MQSKLKGTYKRRSHGMALIVVLIFISASFLVVALGARMSLMGEKSARNDLGRQLAFQAAEAALGDAELDLMGPNKSPKSRVCSLDSRNVHLFAEGCGNSDENRGLCAANSYMATPLYKSIDFEDVSPSRRYVRLGEYTGQAANVAVGSAISSALPRYVIETVPFNIPGGFSNSKAFLVTALGYGNTQQTQVMLQSVIFKPGQPPECKH